MEPVHSTLTGNPTHQNRIRATGVRVAYKLVEMVSLHPADPMTFGNPDLEKTVTTQKAKPQHGGFTLIEMVITVSIVGILSAIAYPSYQSAMRKNNRAAAESFLANVARRQQQYLLDQRSYASSVTTLGTPTPASVTPYYTIAISVAAGPPPSFTASATPIGSQASDLSGAAITITNTGAKGPSGAW
jgi:type IV pilus assembly protein PilE